MLSSTLPGFIFFSCLALTFSDVLLNFLFLKFDSLISWCSIICKWPHHLFPGTSVVPLPSPHHRWSVSNSSVARVDPSMGVTTALHLGVTTVVVEDMRVAGHIQVSSLNVVLPDTIRIYVAPFSTVDSLGVEEIPTMARWYVVSGRQYLIQVKVFSRGPGAQEIYLTQVTHVSSSFVLLRICVEVIKCMNSLQDFLFVVSILIGLPNSVQTN